MTLRERKHLGETGPSPGCRCSPMVFLPMSVSLASVLELLCGSRVKEMLAPPFTVGEDHIMLIPGPAWADWKLISRASRVRQPIPEAHPKFHHLGMTAFNVGLPLSLLHKDLSSYSV